MILPQEKEAIEVIANNERRMKRLFDISPYGIVLAHSDGEINLNKAAIDIFKCESQANTNSFNIENYIKSKYQYLAEKRKEKLQKNDERNVIEIPIILHDGIEKIVEITDSYLNDKKELMTIIRDITKIKKHEFEIEQNQNLLRTIIDTNPNLIYLKDSSANYIITNMVFANLYGMTPQEIEGKTHLDRCKSPKSFRRRSQCANKL